MDPSPKQCSTLLLLAVWLTEGDEGVGDAHTLFVTRGEYLVGGELDEGKLQRGATAV